MELIMIFRGTTAREFESPSIESEKKFTTNIIDALGYAYQYARSDNAPPLVIVGEGILGAGVKPMEGNPEWFEARYEDLRIVKHLTGQTIGETAEYCVAPCGRTKLRESIEAKFGIWRAA